MALTVAAGFTGCSVAPPSAVVGVVTDSCRPGHDTGAGVIVAPGLVLTSAHVLAGADSIHVHRDGHSVPAEVVGFDPEMDLAYLSVEGLGGVPLPVSSDGVSGGDTGTAYVMRGEAVAEVPVTVTRRVNIRTEDIYVEGETLRPGLELDADIELGDSGAAVVIRGNVVGVVWARSRAIDDRSYAIDPDRAGELIAEQLRTEELGDDIELDRCP